MTAVIVGTGCACAVFGVIVASLIIGSLVGVCRLNKFKAREKRYVRVHANVMYYNIMSVYLRIYVGFQFLCMPLYDIKILLYGLYVQYYII